MGDEPRVWVPVNDDFDSTLFSGNRIDPGLPASPETLGHYLVVLGGPGAGKRLEIAATTPITIGRDAQQTLVYADAELSRRHARVSLVNGKALVEDLRSTNGTFVNGERITDPVPLVEGEVIRVGSQFFRYEQRSRRDVERAEELDRDLQKASRYVSSLLPAPLAGGPVLAEWSFVPSTQLGGDAFGYYWLDPDTFVFYLVDVSGHGVGSAMHSVTVLNVLRQRALPNVDFKDPVSVLSSLNTRFQMDGHNGMFFTMWYGVYHVGDRVLTSSSAGHHPAYLVSQGKTEMRPLGAPALMIGVFPDGTYEVQRTTIAPGSSLYVFSDGAFEIVTTDGERWTLTDFLPILLEPASPGVSEAERIFQSVKRAAGPNSLEDDFSLMVVTFK